jgi:hypothetical protein
MHETPLTSNHHTLLGRCEGERPANSPVSATGSGDPMEIVGLNCDQQVNNPMPRRLDPLNLPAHLKLTKGLEPVPPIENALEACLMRYYVEQIAPWVGSFHILHSLCGLS